MISFLLNQIPKAYTSLKMAYKINFKPSSFTNYKFALELFRYPFFNKEKAVLLLLGGTYAGGVAYAYKCKDVKAESNCKKAIAGSIALLLTEIFLLPLDAVNMRLKAQDHTKSFRNIVKSIYTQHGVRGFWKGSQPVFYYTVFGGFAYFYFYELFRKRYDDCTSAGLSDLIMLMFIHPLEFIKTRMQCSKNKEIRFSEELGKLLRKPNSKKIDIRRLYTGLIPNVVTSMGFMFGQYGIYHYFRSLFKTTSMKSNDNLSILISSSLSGLVASTCTNGFETMAVKMQSSHNSQAAKMPKLTWKMFTSGLMTRISYYVTMSIVEFFLLEHVYRKFGVNFCKDAH